MSEQQIILADVLITANAANRCKTISETDIKMRYVSNSQEVLRIVQGFLSDNTRAAVKQSKFFARI